MAKPTLNSRIADVERVVVILARAIRGLPRPLTHVEDHGAMETTIDTLAEGNVSGAVADYNREAGDNGGGG